MAVSVTWAALLAAAPVVELQPLLAAVSRQLQHSPHWAGQRGGNGDGDGVMQWWCRGKKKGWEVQKMQEKVDITKVAFDAFFGDFGYITNKMYIILWMFKFNYGVFLVGLIGYSQQSGDIMGIEWDNLYHWPCGYCISLDDVIGTVIFIYIYIYTQQNGTKVGFQPCLGILYTVDILNKHADLTNNLSMHNGYLVLIWTHLTGKMRI